MKTIVEETVESLTDSDERVNIMILVQVIKDVYYKVISLRRLKKFIIDKDNLHG